MQDLSGICYNDVIGDAAAEESSKNGTTGKSNSAHNGNPRRKHGSRWDKESNHSCGSLLSSIEKFVHTVDDMNETILVPCRLMDMKFDQPGSSGPLDAIGNGGDGSVAESKRLLQNLNGVDFFQFYSMLNTVKNELMWGNKSFAGTATTTTSATPTVNGHQGGMGPPAQSQSTEVKGHVRRPSTVSTTSSASTSDTEISELNEDSGVEAEEEYSQHMADSFHRHLSGLQQCLRDLTLTADYVTTRYNTDVGGASN